MAKCQYCERINEYHNRIEIVKVRIEGDEVELHMPLLYCPACGKMLSRYNPERPNLALKEAIQNV